MKNYHNCYEKSFCFIDREIAEVYCSLAQKTEQLNKLNYDIIESHVLQLLMVSGTYCNVTKMSLKMLSQFQYCLHSTSK